MTIHALLNDKASHCRFPARKRFLAEHLPHIAFPEPEICQGLKTFRQAAPTSKVSIVFAAENLFYPSSELGHTMLVLTGTKPGIGKVRHAVSFFTHLNIAKLPIEIWDSLVHGKEGVFLVSPFQEKVYQYRDLEQRNLWEFDLRLTPKQITLMHDHIWEVRYANYPYFFQSMNCATIVLKILKAVEAKIDISDYWVTPKDVIRTVHKRDLISLATVNLSKSSAIRILEHQTKEPVAKAIADLDYEVLTSKEAKDVDHKIAQLYLDRLYLEEDIDQVTYKEKSSFIDKNRSNKLGQFGYSLDYSPLASLPDSQFSVGAGQINGSSGLNFKLLPASHRLEDDNRAQGAETAMELMSLSFDYILESNSLALDYFYLYSARILLPRTTLSKAKSGRFALGLSRNDPLNHPLRSLPVINGGVGYTYALHDDIGVFGEIGGEFQLNSDPNMIFMPQIGFYIYEVFDMKTIVSYKKIYGLLEQRQETWIELNHSIFLSKKWSIHFLAQHIENKSDEDRSYLASLKRRF